MTAVEETAPRAESAPTPGRTSREQVRRVLLLVGIVPVVIALAFLAKVLVMGGHDRGGREAWDERDAATAMEHYSANRHLNVLEPWIAHFDAGNAAFLLGEHARALAYYDDALQRVPHAQECTVRINISLTHETIGDQAREHGDEPTAKSAYQAAIKALEDGDCPTDAGQGREQSEQGDTVDKRVKGKLDPGKQQSQPKKDDDQEKPQKPDKKEEQLDRRNGDGESYRRDDADLDDYGGFSDEPQW